GRETPPPPSHFRADLDPTLERIVAKAMSRRPEERYGSAQEFAKALANWSPHRVAVAESSTPRLPAEAGASKTKPQPPSPRGRRRMPVLVAVAAALLVAVGGGVLLPQIIIRIRNKDGQETKIEVPTGSKITIEESGKVLATVPARDDKSQTDTKTK